MSSLDSPSLLSDHHPEPQLGNHPPPVPVLPQIKIACQKSGALASKSIISELELYIAKESRAHENEGRNGL